MKCLLAIVLVLAVGQSSAGLFDTLQRLLVPGNPWKAPSTWTNMVSVEVDSTEHGVKAGKKSTTCICGNANRAPGSRIVGGKEYKAHEYPFIAGLVRLKPYTPFCGGTIVSTSHVITAAHCTADIIGKESLHVLAGDFDRSTAPAASAVIVAVAGIAQHPLYNPQILHNDISVLILAAPLQFGKNVGAACMPPRGLDITGKYVRVIGWGAQTNQGPMTMRPRKVDLRVVDTFTCSSAWNGMISFGTKHLCTHSTKKTACQGDSGGPVIWVDPDTNRYTLVGAVSFGAKCGDSKPSIQTDISAHLDWINSIIRGNTKFGSKTCTKK